MNYLEEKIVSLMNELIEGQKGKLLKLGREFVPNLTFDDILQPIDYPVLEYNPHFRHEEGVLEGLQSAKAALCALLKEKT